MQGGQHPLRWGLVLGKISTGNCENVCIVWRRGVSASEVKEREREREREGERKEEREGGDGGSKIERERERRGEEER